MIVEYSERDYTEEEFDIILCKAIALGLDDDPQLDFLTVADMERLVTYIV
jgi:hypothetical protein